VVSSRRYSQASWSERLCLINLPANSRAYGDFGACQCSQNMMDQGGQLIVAIDEFRWRGRAACWIWSRRCAVCPRPFPSAREAQSKEAGKLTPLVGLVRYQPLFVLAQRPLLHSSVGSPGHLSFVLRRTETAPAQPRSDEIEPCLLIVSVYLQGVVEIFG